jgi:hypothetical protein
MGNRVIIPLDAFEYPSLKYYRVLEVRKYEFGVVTYDTTSIPNVMNFLPAILYI